MSTLHPHGPRTPAVEKALEQLIEPLAALICATDAPHETLHRVANALVNAVGEINHLAVASFPLPAETHVG